MENAIWCLQNIFGIVGIIGAGMFVGTKLDKIACDIWDRVAERRADK